MSEVSDMISEMDELFTDLYSRMDEDRNLARLDDYKMTDANGKQITGITEITRNNPQALRNNIVGKLSTSHMQIEVSGRNLKDKQGSMIEDFCEGVLKTVDMMLLNREIGNLFDWALDQAALRGRIAARSTIRKDKAKTGRQAMVDIIPMDARFLSYMVGINGIEQLNYISEMTKSQIKSQWGRDVSATTTVNDFWLPSKNIIVIGNDEISQTTPYPYVPAVCQLTNFGFSFGDKDNPKYVGESIFMALRDTFKNLNRAASIEATIAEKAVRNATTIEGNDDLTYPDLPDQDPTSYGEMTALRKGEKIEVLEFADKNRSSISLDAKLSSDEQKGGSPVTAFGDRGGTESAKQVIMLSVAESRLTGPILKACANFYERLLYMIIRQVVDQALTIVVGDIGFEQEYKWSELKGNYRIKVTFTPQDPMLDAANISVAAEAKSTGLFSDDTLRRDFIKHKNPDLEKEKIDEETVEKLDPVLMLYRKVHSLIESDKNLEAKRLAQKCFDVMGQEKGFPLPVQIPPKKMTHQIFDDLFEQAMTGGENPLMKIRAALANVQGGQAPQPRLNPPRQSQPGSSGHLLPMFSGRGRQPATPEGNVTKELVAEASKNG